MSNSDVRKTVRERYGAHARKASSCCGGGSATAQSSRIGYSQEELASIPEGANLGLGCGNPTALASLQAGEIVLDLGSGAGIDCFLAAEAVGPSGRVIGVDMTADMIDRARSNAVANGVENTEFRLGEIEHLPVADGEIDVIISNCVINLSPDKSQVFREAFRVLKPGGRLMVSDIVQLKPMPEKVKQSIDAYVGCIAGASLKDEYLAQLRSAGFEHISVEKEVTFGSTFSCCEGQEPTIAIDGEVVSSRDLGLSTEEVVEIGNCMASISVRAVKAP